MRKQLLTAAIATIIALPASAALETSVAPKVTDLQTKNPTTGLYVGNSYTYYNCGVNGYVRGLAKEGKHKWTARMCTISAGMLSFHDIKSYLAPHEMDPYDKNAKKFDVVFLQGQSAEPFDAKRAPTFKKFLQKHINTIRAAGSEPVVVLTWAKQDKPEDTRKLADATISEANANNAIVLPVGLAFAQAIKERPDLVLHHTDKSHPSAAGSYLYGAMIYSLLFKKSPEGFQFPGDCAKPIATEDAKFLQQIAWRVTKEFYGWQ